MTLAEKIWLAMKANTKQEFGKMIRCFTHQITGITRNALCGFV